MMKNIMGNAELILALAAMSTVSDNNTRGHRTTGAPYTPPRPTPEQERQIARDARSLQHQHRFVIGGREVWARNRKDAIRKAQKA